MGQLRGCLQAGAGRVGPVKLKEHLRPAAVPTSHTTAADCLTAKAALTSALQAQNNANAQHVAAVRVWVWVGQV